MFRYFKLYKELRTKLGTKLDTLPPGCVKEDTCMLGNGLRVNIGPLKREPNARSFSAEYTSNITPIWRYAVYVLVLSVVLSIFGGVFLKFYGPHRINTYLNYPSTNCTVVAYSSATDNEGNVFYKVQVEYVNTKNETIQHQMKIYRKDFNSKNWTIGDQFKCVYKGKFIEQYSELESALSSVKSIWYLGIFSPLVSLMLMGGITICIVVFALRAKSKYYFPRTVTFRDDFMISDWGHIPSNVQQMFYATMVGYHAAEELTTNTSLSFWEPRKSRVAREKGGILALGILVLLLGLGMSFFGGWCLYGYNALLYLLGIYMIVISSYMFGIAIFLFHDFLQEKREVETISGHLTLKIMYTVKPNKIYGTNLLPLPMCTTE